LCTGISKPLRTAVLSAAFVFLIATGSSRAQILKLRGLALPPDVQAGSWVAYQIKVDSKNRPSRQFQQRLAVVAREGAGNESGAWVELKSLEAGKTRIERGFFALADRDTRIGMKGTDGKTWLRIARYQSLTPDGKLYEYPVGEEGAPTMEEDISAMGLFEFAEGAKLDSLPADTLRVGRKVIPCEVARTRRFGNDKWAGDDTTFVNRAVMTRTYWRSRLIPATGYARSVLEVSTERIPVGAATVDTTATTAGVEATQSVKGLIYRADATLLDFGSDAIPEVTQPPEPAPEGSHKPKVIK
jgi:hypothetical protein